ncbi:MAG: gamma-glutamyltransferase family protein [Planctomycetota bacterium]
MKAVLRASSVAAVVLASACTAVDPFRAAEERVPPAVGAVVSEHPLATKAGLLVLEAGGNAADAAVATALALAVVYPQAGNLGGGGFAVWVPAPSDDAEKNRPATLDFREIAPAGYGVDLYVDESGEVVRSRSLTTPLAVGVPGSPRGLYELYRMHGSRRLSFTQLSQGAIRLAEDGFAVDEWLARDLARSTTRAKLMADPGAAAVFYPDGEPLAVGERLVQPALARTLRILAQSGPDRFYGGPVARAIVEDLRDADERMGSVAGDRLMNLDDLAAYRVTWREPLVAVLRGYEFIGMGPPSSGGVALFQILGILDGLPLDVERRSALERIELGLADPPQTGRLGNVDPDAETPLPGPSGLDARGVHWWIEAMRFAFADRAVHLGDPDHVDVPVDELLDASWLARRRVSIGERARLDAAAWAPAPRAESLETTHLSVVDREGNAVSLTTTLNGSFGSGIFVDAAGFLLNNELDDFSIRPGTPNMYGLVGSAANQLAPGKRPLSSMTPVVARDGSGRVALVIGAPGGPRIITAVAQVVLRILLYDQSLVDAIRAPRLHQQWNPEVTSFEDGWDPSLLDVLVRVHGQPIRSSGGRTFASVQGILVQPDGTVDAYSDPRRGGAAGLEGEDPMRPARPIE